MPVTKEQLIESVNRLRERRLAILELRDYKPQSRSKSSKSTSAAPAKPVEETFADLFSRGGNSNEEGGEN